MHWYLAGQTPRWDNPIKYFLQWALIAVSSRKFAIIHPRTTRWLPQHKEVNRLLTKQVRLLMWYICDNFPLRGNVRVLLPKNIFLWTVITFHLLYSPHFSSYDPQSFHSASYKYQVISPRSWRLIFPCTNVTILYVNSDHLIAYFSFGAIVYNNSFFPVQDFSIISLHAPTSNNLS